MASKNINDAQSAILQVTAKFLCFIAKQVLLNLV